MELTGTKRPGIHCKICKKTYLDPCVIHYGIKNSWELSYAKET